MPQEFYLQFNPMMTPKGRHRRTMHSGGNDRPELGVDLGTMAQFKIEGQDQNSSLAPASDQNAQTFGRQG